MKLALALAMALVAPAYAAGDAPLASLVPEEWKISVFEVTCEELGDCCSIETPCSVPYKRAPDPAPVPLPPTLLLLTAAIAAMIWKGSKHV